MAQKDTEFLEKFNQKYNSSFCIKPFTELCNTPNNNLKLCCHSDSVDIKKHDSSKTLYDYYLDHPTMLEIRRKMLAGETVSECNVCYKKEKIHGNSMRTKHTVMLEERDPELVKSIFATGEKQLRTMDIKFGNKCNLGCVMCNDKASSVIANEWYYNEVPEKSGLVQLSDKDKLVTEFNSVEFEKLKQHAGSLKRFSAKGGEPMILPEYHQWIDFLVESKYSEDIEVYIITNGTVDFSKDLEKMNQFKEYEVCWSIDAIGKGLEYVRWPVKFEKLSRNHHKIIAEVKAKNYQNLLFMINTVAHVLNIDQIVKVAEYADSLGLIHQVEFLNCFGPDGMLNGLISEKTLNQFRKDIDDYHGKFKPGLEKLYTEVEYNWHHIRKDQDEFQDQLIKLKNMTDFWKHTRGLDVQEYCSTYQDTIAQLK